MIYICLAREGLERNRPKIENSRVIVYNLKWQWLPVSHKKEGGWLTESKQYESRTSGYIQKEGANKDDKHHCKNQSTIYKRLIR